MKKEVEIIQGDPSLRLNLYVIIAFYILFIILIEPAIDFILLSIYKINAPLQLEQMNKIKIVLSALLYVALGLIPAFYASWFGYRIVASAKLPPVLLSGKTSFPFTVAVIKGKQAKMFGVLIIIVALVLVLQLFLYAAKVFLF